MTALMNPQIISLIIAIVVAIIILTIGLSVARLLWKGDMDISMMLMEMSTDPQGQVQMKASLSRFQFLVFTFVVAGLYFILSLETGHLLDVPNGTLILLGISGGSYLASKTIASGSDNTNTPAGPGSQVPAPPGPDVAPSSGVVTSSGAAPSAGAAPRGRATR
jgi:uncharacterized membrane protein